jgi:hypothetical protein
MACPSCGYDEPGDPAACGRCAFVLKKVPAQAAAVPEAGPEPFVNSGPSRLPKIIAFVVVSWIVYGVTMKMTQSRNAAIEKMVRAETESERGPAILPAGPQPGEAEALAAAERWSRADFDNLWKVYAEIDGVAMMLSMQQAVATKEYGSVTSDDVKLGFKPYNIDQRPFGMAYVDDAKIGPGTTYAPMSLMQALRAAAADPRIQGLMIVTENGSGKKLAKEQIAALLKELDDSGRKDADEPLKVMRRPASN